MLHNKKIEIESNLVFRSFLKQSLTNLILDIDEEHPDIKYYLSEKTYRPCIPLYHSSNIRFIGLYQKGPESYKYSMGFLKKTKPLIEISYEAPLLDKLLTLGDDIGTSAFLYNPDLSSLVEKHIGRIKSHINKRLIPTEEGKVIFIDIPNNKIAHLYKIITSNVSASK
jgi:hypothetical protein